MFKVIYELILIECVICNKSINYSFLFYFVFCDVVIVVVLIKGDIFLLVMKLLLLLGFVILELRKDVYLGNLNLVRLFFFIYMFLIRKLLFLFVVVKVLYW